MPHRLKTTWAKLNPSSSRRPPTPPPTPSSESDLEVNLEDDPDHETTSEEEPEPLPVEEVIFNSLEISTTRFRMQSSISFYVMARRHRSSSSFRAVSNELKTTSSTRRGSGSSSDAVSWSGSSSRFTSRSDSDDGVDGGIGGRREDDGFSFAHVVFKQRGIVRGSGSRAGARCVRGRCFAF